MLVCSVLSSNDEACAVLTENPDFANTCVNVLKKYPGRQVEMSFIFKMREYQPTNGQLENKEIGPNHHVR